jgi:hypothetical protein
MDDEPSTGARKSAVDDRSEGIDNPSGIVHTKEARLRHFVG